jgi:predicted secreted Zn-dependent protease
VSGSLARAGCAVGALAAAACRGPSPGVTRPAPRGVVIQGSIQRYSVAGRTEAEIAASLAEAQRREGGFAGHYRAFWRYNYRYLQNAEVGRGATAGCRIADVRIDLQSIIREPDWQQPPDAPAALVGEWQTFFAALEDHEREHERIAVEAAGSLVETLERMREMDCYQLAAMAEREGRRLSDVMQERQAQLDRDTQHGATMSVRWPPSKRRPAPDSAPAAPASTRTDSAAVCTPVGAGAPRDTTAPAVVRARQDGVIALPPGLPASLRGRLMVLMLHVTERGAVDSVEVAGASDPDYTPRLRERLLHVRYHPALVRGCPVASWVELRLRP